MINCLLSNQIYFIDDTIRYNGRLTFQRFESVSQHSYWVTFYCNLFFRSLFNWYLNPFNAYSSEEVKFKQVNDLLNRMHLFLLRQAIYHDFDENFTGDVSYYTKYDKDYGDEIKAALNKIKLKKVEQLERDNLYDDYMSTIRVNENLTKEQITLCMNILKASDWMSCLRFSFVEINAGNKTFEDVFSNSIFGIESCMSTVETMLQYMGLEEVDECFFSNIRHELIELKTKFNLI